jgi:hypothetical protein
VGEVFVTASRANLPPDKVRIFSGESVADAKRALNNGKYTEDGPAEPRDFLGNSNGLRCILPSTIHRVTFLLTRLTEYNPT